MAFLYNVPKYGIDKYLDNDLQAIYGIVVMPATIIMLINQLIIQILITILKDSYQNGDKKNFISYVRKIILITILVGIAALICGYFLGLPVLVFSVAYCAIRFLKKSSFPSGI